MITFIDLTERKRAADLVNEARLYSESIVATVREPLVVLDGSLLVRSANQSFYKTFQLSPEDVANRPLFSLQERRWDIPELRQVLTEMLVRDTEVVDFELVMPFGDAGDRTMLLNARSIRTPDGRPNLVLLAIEDITERKRAERELKTLSEARLRAIVTTAADAIVTIDEHGLIESCNPATERMFGYAADAMIGRNVKLLIPWTDFEGGNDGLIHDLSTEDPHVHSLRRDVIGRRSDGSTFPMDLALSELHEGSRHLFTGIMHDISERKSLQQELLSIADAEQRRIGQDLHDDIGQELTGLAMKAETLSEIVTERQIPEHALAADIVAGLDRTRAKVRALSRGLIPVEIDSNGLVDALDQLTARLGDLHHTACVFECRDRSVQIDVRRATQLYHIAQEGITNALKHAQPGTSV